MNPPALPDVGPDDVDGLLGLGSLEMLLGGDVPAGPFAPPLPRSEVWDLESLPSPHLPAFPDLAGGAGEIWPGLADVAPALPGSCGGRPAPTPDPPCPPRGSRLPATLKGAASSSADTSPLPPDGEPAYGGLSDEDIVGSSMQELIVMLGSKGADKALVASVKKHRRRLQTRRSVAEFRRKKQASSKSAAAEASSGGGQAGVRGEYDALVAEVLRIHGMGAGPAADAALGTLARKLRAV